MLNILKTKARKILLYFNDNGLKNIKLTIYIFDSEVSIDNLVKLEQHFFDTLKPNLNMTLIARATYNNGAMSENAKSKLEKGIPIFIYDVNNLNLLYIFESKQDMYNKLHIHHSTLNKCLELGELYLDNFLLSLDYIEEFINEDILSLNEIINLITKNREIHKITRQPKAKKILAEFKDNPNNNKVFSSLNELTKYLKGDRIIIRKYLKGEREGYYRGV
jgi:hypothetical protein